MASEIESTQPEAGADSTTNQPAQVAPVERGYCRLHRVTLPVGFPTQPRPDLPIRRALVVATRSGEELLCGCEHDGPHLWSNGDESGDWPDEIPT